jgi:hypothetical protein
MERVPEVLKDPSQKQKANYEKRKALYPSLDNRAQGGGYGHAGLRDSRKKKEDRQY